LPYKEALRNKERSNFITNKTNLIELCNYESQKDAKGEKGLYSVVVFSFGQINIGVSPKYLASYLTIR